MPVVFQKFIYREDLQANPEVLYVFGDNYGRQGMGGQAKEMRGEPNAVGVATKKAPTHLETDYFSDDAYEYHVRRVKEDFQDVVDHLQMEGVVVIPSDGIGTGLSRLPEFAPEVDTFIKDYIAKMKTAYR
jgi:hypothetical protein